MKNAKARQKDIIRRFHAGLSKCRKYGIQIIRIADFIT
jgi:hypothetical protein